MCCYEMVIKNHFHITGKEGRIGDAIQLRVDVRIGNGFGNIFDANHLFALGGAKIGYCTCAGIEVIERLTTMEVCKVACHLVEYISLFGVGLIKRFWSHFKPKALHLLNDVILATVANRGKVTDRVVPFGIYDIVE